MKKSLAAEPLALMYHGLDPGDGRYARTRPWVRAYILKQEDFAGHLEAIEALGRQLAAPTAQSLPLGPGQLLLTFDDGMASDRDVALAMLRERGLGALFFVTPGRVGLDGYLDRSDLAELADAGMGLGAHGYSHRFLPELGPAGQREELERARDFLAEATGAAPWALSLPGGRYDRHTLEAARETGYRAVFTSEPLAAREREGLWVLGRLALREGFDGARMRDFLEHQDERLAEQRRGHRRRKLLRTILGDRLYDGLHQAYWKNRARPS